MAYELEIHYDGIAPGITEHRLSVSAFGPALNQLLLALRRIATQMVRSAVEGERPKVGRFADLGRSLDIEITHVNGNSLGLSSVVTFNPPATPQSSLPYWDNLPERAGAELLDAIDRESKGELTNAAVRNYLSFLPPGVTRQEYNFHANGRVIKRVEVGEIKLTALPPELPYLREIEGDIVGVGFEPARNEVRVKPEGGSTSSLAATADEVEGALAMRHDKVRTLAVHTSKGTRIVSVARASDPRFKFLDAAVEEHIFKRWNELLGRLAK